MASILEEIQAANIRWCVYCGMDLFLSDRPRKGVCDICQGKLPAADDDFDDDDFDDDDLFDDPDDCAPSWLVFRRRIEVLRSLLEDEYDEFELYEDEIMAAKAAIDVQDAAEVVRTIQLILDRGDACEHWSGRLNKWKLQAEKLREKHGNKTA